MHAGAQLPAAKQAQLKELNKKLSTLADRLHAEIARRCKAGALHVSDQAMLAGLSQQEMAAASEAAKARKVDGK